MSILGFLEGQCEILLRIHSFIHDYPCTRTHAGCGEEEDEIHLSSQGPEIETSQHSGLLVITLSKCWRCMEQRTNNYWRVSGLQRGDGHRTHYKRKSSEGRMHNPGKKDCRRMKGLSQWKFSDKDLSPCKGVGGGSPARWASFLKGNGYKIRTNLTAIKCPTFREHSKGIKEMISLLP